MAAEQTVVTLPVNTQAKREVAELRVLHLTVWWVRWVPDTAEA